MSVLDYLCNYCDHKFEVNSYKKIIKCPNCDDSNVKEIKRDTKKVNYYPEDEKEPDLQQEFYNYLINGGGD